MMYNIFTNIKIFWEYFRKYNLKMYYLNHIYVSDVCGLQQKNRLHSINRFYCICTSFVYLSVILLILLKMLTFLFLECSYILIYLLNVLNKYVYLYYYKKLVKNFRLDFLSFPDRSVCWKRDEWGEFPRDSVSRPLQSLHVFHLQSPIHQQLHGNPGVSHRPGNRPGTAHGCKLLRLLNVNPAPARDPKHLRKGSGAAVWREDVSCASTFSSLSHSVRFVRHRIP